MGSVTAPGRLRLRRATAAAVALLAAVSSSARADAGAPPTVRARGAPPASARQKLDAAAAELARVRQAERALAAELARARADRDLLGLACLEDRLPEVARLARFAERSTDELKELLARGEDGGDIALTATTQARVRAERAGAEAERCPRRAPAPSEGTSVPVRVPDARGRGR